MLFLFFRADITTVCGDQPLVAKRVFQHGHAVAPELVFDGLRYRTTRLRMLPPGPLNLETAVDRSPALATPHGY